MLFKEMTRMPKDAHKFVTGKKMAEYLTKIADVIRSADNDKRFALCCKLRVITNVK